MRLWNALPGDLPRGYGTTMVESLQSWLARQSLRCGIPVPALFEFLGLPRYGVWPSVFDGLSSSWPSIIEGLSKLMDESIAQGSSFHRLRPIACNGFLGVSPQRIRWCPLCLKENIAEPYVPLIFSLHGCVICPVHGCDVIGECSECGAKQNKSWEPDKWKLCRRCGAPLHIAPTYSPNSRYQKWTQGQCEEVVLFCSSEDQDPVASDSARLFMAAIAEEHVSHASTKGDSKSGLAQQILARKSKITLPTLMLLAACAGVGVVDVLTRPSVSASRPLFAPWRSPRTLKKLEDLPMLEETVTSIAGDLRWFLGLGYVPSSDAIGKAMHLPPGMIRDLGGSSWESYHVGEGRCVFEGRFEGDSALPFLIRESLTRLKGRIRKMSLLDAASMSTASLRRLDENARTVICAASLRIALRILPGSHRLDENFDEVYESYRNSYLPDSSPLQS